MQSLYSVALYGSLSLASTSWLKYFAVTSHDFALVLVMQSFCAISHIFLSAIPSKLNAWFPQNEEFIISGVSIFCNNSGIILNFISLMLIDTSKGLSDLSRHLHYYMLLAAIISTLIALVIVVTFQVEEPEHPPSYYKALKRELIIQNDTQTFLKALHTLLLNKNFIWLTLAMGLQLGIFNGFSTLINPIVIYYFPVSRDLDTYCSLLIKIICRQDRLKPALFAS